MTTDVEEASSIVWHNACALSDVRTNFHSQELASYKSYDGMFFDIYEAESRQ